MTTRAKIHNTTLELVNGDITKQAVDAVVNAANSALAGGGGVDGAIHRVAGRDLMKELRERYRGGCPTGEARITTGYNLPAKFVIHAVGPIYRNVDNPAELLASAHSYSLKLAQENNAKTIAFPAISTGVYGYPMEEAATVALSAVADYIKKHQPDFELVRFVLYSANPLKNPLKTFSQALADLIDSDEVVQAL
ncbi:MAG: O-acetyl-ADP-ribose deacetylase [Chloroflexota bacterium]